MSALATKYMRLKDAVDRKYTFEADERKARKLKSLRSLPHLQPWAGYSLREGRAKFWPEDDIDEWADVFDHNREEYFRELLNDTRDHVRAGVRAQLCQLRDAGALPELYVEILEGL